jgi:hypothetical protein
MPFPSPLFYHTPFSSACFPAPCLPLSLTHPPAGDVFDYLLKTFDAEKAAFVGAYSETPTPTFTDDTPSNCIPAFPLSFARRPLVSLPLSQSVSLSLPHASPPSSFYFLLAPRTSAPFPA